MYTFSFKVNYTLRIPTLFIVFYCLNNDIIDILENNSVDLLKYSLWLTGKSVNFRSRLDN